jgi:N-acetylmuramoyl-L-alanine amidase
MLIKDYDGCTTGICRTLDLQIIAELQVLTNGELVKIKTRDKLVLADNVHPYLNRKAEESLGKINYTKILSLNSCYRTVAQQLILFQNAQKCGLIAAKPGKSNHQSGLAIDINDSHYWQEQLEYLGWNKLGSFDDMHFDFNGTNLQSLSIKAFQVLANKNNYILSLDGELGAETLYALRNAPVEGFENGLVSRKLAFTNPQQHGNDVKELQTKLGLRADGWFGKETEKALTNGFKN